MDWIVPFLCGLGASVISAWGVGGGTLLLLVMTLFLGVDQRTAQGINLLFFLPTAAGALVCHAKGGYLDKPTLKAAVPIAVAAALAGACIGFLPYNFNPAKIFMGDTGSTFLGYVLAVISIQGLFKMYTLISFVVPFLLFGLPIFDTCFAFIRRIAHGQSPMHADRGHVHHRLIDMGFSQKQAVAVLYVITAILGLSAVVLTTSGAVKAMLLLVAFCAAGAVALSIFQSAHQPPQKKEPRGEENEEGEGEK